MFNKKLVCAKTNSVLFHLLESYCLGKSRLWNMVFGWRKTIDKGINGEYAFYKINGLDFEILYKEAEKLERILEED